MNAVAGQLGVDPEDVQITDVSVDDRGGLLLSIILIPVYNIAVIILHFYLYFKSIY